jgi:hypothetical protein
MHQEDDMRILKAILPGMALALLAAVAMGQGLPRNSYLEKRVDSTAELVQQLRSNPVVMDRYRRHFAMTDAEVITYLSSLRVSELPKDGIYTVYGVPKTTGDFHARLRMLKKGEPVFVEEDGTPVLQLVCGNPLILGPKKPVVPNPIVANAGPVEGAKEVTVEAPPAPSTNAVTPVVPGEAQPIAPVFPQPHGGSSPVAALLGLAGAVAFFPHGGTPPTVPEPMTMLVMGSGLAYLASRRRAKKTA